MIDIFEEYRIDKEKLKITARNYYEFDNYYYKYIIMCVVYYC